MLCFSLGSNLGDRLSTIRQALALLAEELGSKKKVSSVYETEPWGVEHHEYYLNIVACFETIITPDKVSDIIFSVEKKLGRTRDHRAILPRTIDIDLLFYDDLILESQKLTVPHPRIIYRKFVLVPLAEIMGNFIHPVAGISNKELLLQCTDACSVRKTDVKLFSHDV